MTEQRYLGALVVTLADGTSHRLALSARTWQGKSVLDVRDGEGNRSTTWTWTVFVLGSMAAAVHLDRAEHARELASLGSLVISLESGARRVLPFSAEHWPDRKDVLLVRDGRNITAVFEFKAAPVGLRVERATHAEGTEGTVGARDSNIDRATLEVLCRAWEQVGAGKRTSAFAAIQPGSRTRALTAEDRAWVAFLAASATELTWDGIARAGSELISKPSASKDAVALGRAIAFVKKNGALFDISCEAAALLWVDAARAALMRHLLARPAGEIGDKP